MVLDRGNLRNGIGKLADLRRRAPTRQDDVQIRVARLQEGNHFLRIEVAEFHDDVDLVEDNEVVAARGDGLLADFPDLPRRGDVLFTVLRDPGETVAHWPD